LENKSPIEFFPSINSCDSHGTMSQATQIFDGRAVSIHRARAFKGISDPHFLYQEIDSRLQDRKEDIRRSFDRIVTLSASDSEDVVNRAWRLEDQSADLIISNSTLHWVDDLPKLLLKIRSILLPNGVFLAAFPGGETLQELRQSLVEAESNLKGGASPRVSPFVDLADAAALLQRVGFAMPVADVDRITVTYENIFTLMKDLRCMGETNSLIARRRQFSRRDVFLEADKIYREKFSNKKGGIRVTFEILFLIGWAPHHSQPQPLRPGSAEGSLADFLILKKN
jgi:NADH dehydrogenase [ubiquinone] 1 alpha subcomplex assembly factor 5